MGYLTAWLCRAMNSPYFQPVFRRTLAPSILYFKWTLVMWVWLFLVYLLLQCLIKFCPSLPENGSIFFVIIKCFILERQNFQKERRTVSAAEITPKVTYLRSSWIVTLVFCRSRVVGCSPYNIDLKRFILSFLRNFWIVFR